MKLGDFVRSALSEVVNGVEMAQATANKGKARIVPHRYDRVTDGVYVSTDAGPHNVEFIEFDLPVYVDAGELAVLQGAGTDDPGTYSRIKFRVPLELPPV